MLNHLFLLGFDVLHVLHDIILYNHFVEAAPQPAAQVASPDVTNTVPINSELPNPAASTASGKLIIRCFHMHDCVSLCSFCSPCGSRLVWQSVTRRYQQF